VKPNLSQPKSGVVVTITLEFLYKYGIQLGKCHTRDSIPTKTNTLMQSLSVLYNTINQRSSARLDTRIDGRPAGRSICALQNNKLKFLSETKSVLVWLSLTTMVPLF
jgi:hypothetical protein